MTRPSNIRLEHMKSEILHLIKGYLHSNGLDTTKTPTWLTSNRETEEIEAIGIQFKLKTFELEADKIEDNCQKYYVTYEPLKAYTTIGAKNIHHAFNKATKEFKGKYTKIVKAIPQHRPQMDWEFLSVKEFGELLQKVK